MTPCVEHDAKLIWVDEQYLVECARCMALLPIPSGRCEACSRPLDDHRLTLGEFAVCPR